MSEPVELEAWNPPKFVGDDPVVRKGLAERITALFHREDGVEICDEDSELLRLMLRPYITLCDVKLKDAKEECTCGAVKVEADDVWCFMSGLFISQSPEGRG
ncbi:hypothetical protein KOR42_23090 [Thalassoglobus neptunius]|uniref:Uncharacterized protein n=1 Tax=Thalassoglobus neptunius TaxID=1938619 RepID=A0A5C5XAM8_9PLAN|nr:hypothetical protein [Thalassoglobus neptunius]TWT58922.1 hypothetical protein KOR42_23090 [Thalassoglobus neptunius]